MPEETDCTPDNESDRGEIGTYSGVRGYLSLHSDWDGRTSIAENTEKAEGNRNRPLRAPFPHYMDRGNVQGNEWRREAMKGQMEISREDAETQETNGGVIDLQAQKRKVE